MTLRNIDALFTARRRVVLGGARSAAQRALLANIQATSADSELTHITARPARARVPGGPVELAVIMSAGWARPRLVAALAEIGCKAIVWAAEKPITADVLRAARPYNVRLLGPRSAGALATRAGVNSSCLAHAPRPGRVALITQSQALTAAALDWALGRNVGFSWLACSGSEADIDAADLLDYAALDARTRAVVLQIEGLRAPRKFMSAARAAARVKPVLVLQTGRASGAVAPGPDPARSAAFARAGLVECENMGGLFDGLAALELLPAVVSDRTVVIGNGDSVCAVGCDALARHGGQPARLGRTARAELAAQAPRARVAGAAVDLGDSDIDATLAGLQVVARHHADDALLFVHAPAPGQPHQPLVAALAASDQRARLMTVWLGLHTARAARDASAAARLATFASADAAVRAVHYRARYRYTRELLAATPPPEPSVTADTDFLHQRLAALAQAGVEWLSTQESAHLLNAYGIAAGDERTARATELRIRCALHSELGMVISVADEALGIAPVYGLPPLDVLLARRMLETASAGRFGRDAATLTALARALVRVARMVGDLAPIAGLDLTIALGSRARVHAADDPLVEITPDPPAPAARLALSPYPARMRHRVTLSGEREYVVRAVRPSDEPAVLDLLNSLSAEEIRLRFFSSIRYFSHDMAARLTQVDYDRETALVAAPSAALQNLAGMATLIADPDKREAEFALLVHHAHTRVGLGRHLLDCLLRQAHAHAIATVYGHVLAHNAGMRALAQSLGFDARFSLTEADTVRVAIEVGDYMQRGER